jgi:type IV pilus assembly protein PilO
MAAAGGQRGFAELPVAAKVFMLVLILGVVTAAYYFIFHLSLSDDIESADRRHTELLQRVSAAEQRQQEFLTLSEELASRQPLDRQNRRVLPEDQEIATFLQDLNRLGELSGLEFKLVEPRPEEQMLPSSEEAVATEPAGAGPVVTSAANAYVRIPVSLELRGRFHQVARFFYNVSQLERAINLENVRLTEPAVEGEDVLLEVKVMATTFRRLAESEAGAAAGEGAAH